MAPLVAPDLITLYPPSEDLDEHGWRLPATEAYWQGKGNLQQYPGISDVRASDGGGRGPFGPARDRTGSMFLPVEDLQLIEGSVAECRGRYYYLTQCRFVGDPTGTGDGSSPLDIWTATATSFDTWPGVEVPRPYGEPGEPALGLREAL
jgi:hypothetical protein